ncbi:cupin domain-containing protein [Paenibacillus lutrae]|uniref:Cupin domain-containing protein n=1 Tax=Paenibacillus lutrae TaxID=2078573 RepID=A0A7X3FLS5_9BACL|nr:cupin domain-containing protein [Paenibacillus lutrae]MVP01968.1 cupin domain-containing protein [Paenibacillus lutrae]
MPKKPEIQTLLFKDEETIPNNPALPALLYKRAFEERAAEAEKIFNRNNWLNSWTGGVFDYHHYHSTAHEVLGVISGSAVIQLGGEHGQPVGLETGDVVVLPAGTGHRRLSATADFRVVGAYPDGMEADLLTGQADERPEALERIQRVPVPSSDPVYGKNGPLLLHWKQT